MTDEEKRKLYGAVEKVKKQIDVFGDTLATTIVAISMLSLEERNLVAAMIRDKNKLLSRCCASCGETVFAPMIKNRMYVRWIKILNLGKRKRLRLFVFVLKFFRSSRFVGVSLFEKMLKSAMLYFIKPLTGVRCSQN